VAARAEGRREINGGLALRIAPEAGVLPELGELIDLELRAGVHGCGALCVYS
jgi:hypothetical protein